MNPPGDGVDVGGLVARLTSASVAVPASAFPAVPEEVRGPGLYAWWCDESGLASLSVPFGVPLPPLIYAGQAGAAAPRSGRTSGATLGSRILGNHLHGNVASSTLRKTLAAVLREALALRLASPGVLAPGSNDRLSAWMIDHLRIAVAPYRDRESLAEVEAVVLRTLDPPLNLTGMPPTPVRRRLAALRSELGRPPRSEGAAATGSAPQGAATPAGPPLAPGSPIAGDLMALITRAVQPGDVIRTISQGQPNTVVAIGPDGILVETRRSAAAGSGPHLVPYWMIERVRDHLLATGSVTQQHVLATDGLDVKRSAFVTALIARFDGVHVVSTRPVELRLEGDTPRNPAR